MKQRQTPWFGGRVVVVETVSVLRKILVRLTRDPAVAYGFG